MKPIPVLLAELNAADIHLWVEGARLRFSAPKNALTPALRDELRERKTEIMAFLKRARRGERVGKNIELVARGGKLPLADAQRRMWFLDRLEPNSGAYHIPTGLRLVGPLAVGLLGRAFNQVIRHQESTRTRFPDRGGQPYQVIDAPYPLPFPVIDLGNLDHETAENESARLAIQLPRIAFNLAKGPLLRVFLLKRADNEHVLLMDMHHIISDAWSMGVLVREVTERYRAILEGRAPAIPRLAFQYADYAHHQQRSARQAALRDQLAFWSRRLAEPIPVLRLPRDVSAPTNDSRGSYVTLAITPELTASIKQLVKDQGVTLFITLLAAFKTLLSRYAEQADLIVGTPVAGRREGSEHLIGCFLNTLALRTDLSGEPNFLTLLDRVRQTTLDAFAHADIAFEKLVEELRPERSLNRHPFFNCMFNLINVPDAGAGPAYLKLSPVELAQPDAKFALVMYANEHRDRLGFQLLYRRASFSWAAMQQFLAQWHLLLEQIATDPSRPIRAYSLVTPEARRLLPEVSVSLEKPRFEMIHQTFAHLAAHAPDHVAVTRGTKHRTYGRMAARVAYTAGQLRDRGLAAGKAVAVHGEPGFELIAAMMGVFAAGGVLLALDPELPLLRRQAMMSEAGARLLLHTGESDAAALSPNGLNLRTGRDFHRTSLKNQAAMDEDGPAYVFFTSGTTGKPKGVLGNHQALAHFLHWQRQQFAVADADRCAQLTHLSFDVVLRDIFLPLTAGATLCTPITRLEREPARLFAWFARDRITRFHTVPSLARSWLAALDPRPVLPAVRTVFFAGEPLSAGLVKRWRKSFPRAEVMNLYGPTETTLAKCYLRAPDPPYPGNQPVGFPLPQTQVLVLGRNGAPCGIGEPGEVVLRTPFHAHYLHTEAGNMQAFRPNPHTDNSRDLLYYTGDRGRYLADGALALLGRTDHQIKIHGLRVEPAEVETVLRNHPLVKSVAVLAQKSKREPRLAAFVVPRSDSTPSKHAMIAELRAYARERLPVAMTPRTILFLETLPVTPNGKLDRRALKGRLAGSAEIETGKGGQRAEPRNEIEVSILEIWRDILGKETIGIDEDFFELGGHSLLATRILAKIEDWLGVSLPLRSLFAAPTIAAVARTVARTRQHGQSRPPVIKPSPKRDAMLEYPLSFGQERLWFLSRMDGVAAYNMPFALRLQGLFDPVSWEHCLSAMLLNHDMLRVSFHERDGKPVQRMTSSAEPACPLVDLTHLGKKSANAQAQQLASLAAALPFDLTRAPLLRMATLRLGDTAHVLLAGVHHLIADAWSVGVMVSEWAARYRAALENRPANLAKPEIGYVDFAVWQRQWLNGERLASQLSYWRDRLAGSPGLLELPGDRPRPPVQSFHGALYRFSLPAGLTRQLQALSVHSRVTLFMTTLAAYHVLLARYSGQDEVVVGTPIANRTRSEIEPLIGVFINTLALRARMRERPAFTEFLEQIRQTALSAYDHQDIPFEQVVEALQPERHLAHHPLFQVMFELQNAPLHAWSLPGLTMTRQEAEHATAKFDLNLMLEETDQGLAGILEYNTDLFDGATAARLARHYRVLLTEAAAAPHRNVFELPILDSVEKHLLATAWNDTMAQRSTCEFPAALAKTNWRTPDTIALSYESPSGRIFLVSYEYLGSRVNHLATALRRHGVGRETPVPLCAERNIGFAASLLAILASGGTYLPIDPNLPPRRLRHLIAGSGARLVLTSGARARGLRDLLGKDYEIYNFERTPAGPENSAGESKGSAASLAYVIFTSGSTGTPKGVMVTHAGMANHLRAKIEDLGLSADDVVAQNAPQSFDISVWQFLAPLAVGGRVHIFDEDSARDPFLLMPMTGRQSVTILEVVPSLLRALLEQEDTVQTHLRRLRWLIPTGEALTPEICRSWNALFPHKPMLNAYGPTECSDDVTHYRVAGTPAGLAVPIGRPLQNLTCHVLTPDLERTPLGIIGDLHVGGTGVCRGYLQAPARTATGFIPNPFAGPGARLYKSGDRVRYLADGRLVFLGRVDHQVKLRGFRIELGEIETVLTRHPEVAEAVVVAPEPESPAKGLTAFLTGSCREEAALRSYMADSLPAYMTPASFIFLKSFPLTSNGKIDRAALVRTALDQQPAHGENPKPRRNPVEEVLAGIWTEVLGVPEPSPDANFFALGGHSLLAVQVISRIRQNLGAALPLRAVFEAPTLATQAQWVEAARASSTGNALPPLTPGSKTADAPPLSFAQQRLWFLDQFEGANATYNIATPLHIQGPLDPVSMAGALVEVMSRHEVLRTSFPAQGGKPRQQIAPEPTGQLLFVDLSAALPKGGRKLATRLASDEAHAPFNLANGPLMRVVLLRMEPDSQLLLLTLHHIIADGWSMGVMVRELVAAYDALVADATPDLPPLPVQYADYARWQRAWLQGEVLETQLTYWRRTLAGAPSLLELPLDRVRPPVQSFRGGKIFFVIEPQLVEASRQMSRTSGVTLFMLLQATFAALLARYSGQQAIPVGTPVANRNLPETEPLIGFFVNTLVLTNDLTGHPSFSDLLARVRTMALDAYDHQEIPFEQLVEALQPERNMSHNPLFQAMFAFQNAPLGTLRLNGLSLQPLEDLEHTTAKFDLTMLLEESDLGIEGWLEYGSDLFSAATARRMAHHYRILLRAAIAEPGQALHRLDFFSAGQRHQILLAWNDTRRRLPGHPLVHRVVAAHAERVPDRLALAYENAAGREFQITYSALDARANLAGHRLQTLGIGPERCVAVLGERNIDFWTMMLAILKAGGAYLPIDPFHPAERVRTVLAESRGSLALAAPGFEAVMSEAVNGLPTDRRPTFKLLADLLTGSASPQAPPDRLTPPNLAYILFTSGSTGLPKGAMVVHAGMRNHIHAKLGDLGAGEGDVIPQNGPQCFDVSVWQFLGALMLGGRVEIFNEDVVRDPSLMLAHVVARGITLLELVPSQIGMLLKEINRVPYGPPRLSRLRWMVPTGEVLPPELCREWLGLYPDIPMMNTYGHTECSDDEGHYRFHQAPDPETPRIPIGRPIHNAAILVLNRQFEPAPIGVGGEVHIGGVAVGRGYLNRPERTAAAFLPDPFSPAAGARLYATGDMARYLHDGNMEFLTRVDFQVKIRGFRIEPGEIEAILAHDPSVSTAVVLAREDTPNLKRLVAYVVPERNAPNAEDDQVQAKRWGEVYDEVYRQARYSDADQALNTRVWTNSYTGEAYPEAEIFACVDDTVSRILALQPQRVLEMGCGTGLLLTRLAPSIDHYFGTDISEAALTVLRRHWEQKDGPTVKCRQGEAADFEDIPERCFDVVVINEVVQYFPSIHYLIRVLEGALSRVRPGGHVFVGGVRNLAMLEAFHASVQLARAPDDMALSQWRSMVRQQISREKELLVDPAFFHTFEQGHPGVTGVDIQMKGGAFTNEFTKYRYDVVLGVGTAPRPTTGSRRLNWREAKLDSHRLRRILEEEQPPGMVVGEVPNARNQPDLALLAALRAEDKDTVVNLRTRVENQINGAVSPALFWESYGDLGYEIRLRWSANDPSGSFDAAFVRRNPPESASAKGSDPRGVTGGLPPKAWEAYANCPYREAADHENMIQKLRARCEDRLPEYMLPAAFVVLERLPLNANGKIDRAALPAPDSAAFSAESDASDAYTPEEQVLAGIWAHLLGLEKIGVRDNFFALGGHSLLATQVVSRIREVFGVDIALRVLFEAPTVAGLSRRISRTRQETRGLALPPIRPVPHATRPPLSFAQQRLWFLDQLEPGKATYNLPAALRLSGSLHVLALSRAMAAIISRHETIRTTFASVEGKPYQVIHQSWPLSMPLVDMIGLAESEGNARVHQVVTREAGLPFNLEKGPLFRLTLLRTEPGVHILLITMHHIISDDWSFEVLVRELVDLYEHHAKGVPCQLEDPPVQYADFAVWQRDWARGKAYANTLAYWKRQLQALPPEQVLPLAAPKPARSHFTAGHLHFQLSAEVTASIHLLCRREGATQFMFLLAAFKALVHHHTRTDDVVVGTDVANRNHMEVEGLIGFLINQLVLRTDCSGDPRFSELIGRVRATTLDAYAHQDMPFDQLVAALNPERARGRAPLFQMKLVYHNVPTTSQELPELHLEHIPVEPPTAKFDLLLDLWQGESGFEASFEFNTDRYDEPAIGQLWRQMATVLTRVAAEPETRLSALSSLLAETEQRHEEENLAAWKRTGPAKFKSMKRGARRRVIAEVGSP